MDFFKPVLDFLVGFIGGAILIVILIVAFLMSLQALFDLLQENRIFFKRLSRFIGVLVVVFALFLPFRQMTFYPLFLAFWWLLILFDAIPFYVLIQGCVNAVLSFAYWTNYIARNEGSTFQVIGDFSIFVMVPIAFGAVNLSKDTEHLTGRSKSKNIGPLIPLGSWLHKLSTFVFKLI